MREWGPRGWGAASGGIAVGGLAACVGLERRDATVVRGLVVACIVVALALCLVAGRARQHRSSTSWIAGGARAVARRGGPAPWGVGVALWAALVIAFVAFDIDRVIARRGGAPTLSRVIGDATAAPIGRAALFAGWLLWGAWVAIGWRRPRA